MDFVDTLYTNEAQISICNKFVKDTYTKMLTVDIIIALQMFATIRFIYT